MEELLEELMVGRREEMAEVMGFVWDLTISVIISGLTIMMTMSERLIGQLSLLDMCL